MTPPPSPLAVVGAMHEELRALLPLLEAVETRTLAGRDFHLGRLHGHAVVLVRSGIGKVAAATTAALLVDRFAARAVVFTGVAGGLSPDVAVGDVVVATELLQHDMDASPLFPRHEVPLTGRSRFVADTALSDELAAAAARCLAQPQTIAPREALAALGVVRPTLHRGLVVSGDRFVSSAAQSDALRADLPDALAVEMEGAALAQVCTDFGCPFAVLRTVSDRADGSAHVDFPRFIDEVASACTRAIVSAWLGARRPG